MDNLVDFVVDLINSAGYAGIFVGMLIENIFPPFPSEVVLGLAGLLVSQGHLDLWPATLAATAGVMLSACLFYALGWYGGRAAIVRYGRWFRISEEDLHYTEKWFEAYGGRVVFFGRFLPIIRTLVSIPAGVAGMPFNRFFLFSLIPSFLMSFLFIFISSQLGQRYEEFTKAAKQGELAVAAVLILIFLVTLLYYKERIMRHFFPMKTDTNNKKPPLEEKGEETTKKIITSK